MAVPAEAPLTGRGLAWGCTNSLHVERDGSERPEMSDQSTRNETLPRGIPDDRPAEGDDSAPVSFRLDELRPWGVAAYVAAGMAADDAATVVDNQLWSDRRGVDTHGFQRVSWYVNWFRDGTTDPAAQCESRDSHAVGAGG